jgi:phenylalanyl-tRNA synthetase alpha chain
MSKIYLGYLDRLLDEFRSEISSVNGTENIKRVHKIFWGKNGKLSKATEEFKSLSKEEKSLVGSSLRDLKLLLSKELKDAEKIAKIDSITKSTLYFDPALNNISCSIPKLHPYTRCLNDISDFFKSMGFEIVDGPVLEKDDYNFTFLNIPENHPARNEMDTFWISEKNLLRTHTSTVQIREARKRRAPFAIVSPGAVYRNESTDATHDIMFWQVEGLYISKDASIANMLYVFKKLFNHLFEKDNLDIRVRPGFFPFVEPGVEVDFECPFCSNGCSTCKKTKWIEIGGAGMVHPNVLKHMNVKSSDVYGWAFGLGLTRLVMLKYGISDIRNLHNSVFV